MARESWSDLTVKTTGVAVIMALAIAAIACNAAKADVVIPAEKAAIRTEGGPLSGGGWNLWSNGHVGQPIRIATAGEYGFIVRAWGSPAGGAWPEMALLVDGRALKTVSVGQAEPRDYPFQVELSSGDHEVAAALLNDALVGKEDRNLYLARITIIPPLGAPDPTFPSLKEMAEAAEAREQEVVAATQPAIEKNRKAEAKIRVVDAEGRPVPDVRLTVEQTGHDFLFGANIFGFDRYRAETQNAAYKTRFEELLNYATVGFYWRWYERERGRPSYDYTDKVVGWCREHGIRMKGHPLLWADEAGVPVWSQGQPSPEVQQQRVEEIMHRYQGKIEFWEVVNEPSHLPGLKIDQPYRWARSADRAAYLIVNDYHVLPDGGPAFFKLLSEAKQNGVPFDGIGIQAHEPRTMRFPLDRVQKVLDQYATLGNELHITEYEPAASGQKITGSHRQGTWDEAAQAEYAVKFYRVCFAHTAVRAITWWDLGDQGSFIPGGGMLREDLSPKPVYEQLKRLIHEEWKTSESGATDGEGRFGFRGFLGTYKVVVAIAGKTIEKQFHLEKGKANEMTVSVP
ncbi:MAG: endo-1,4-beta-xylanase [Thermoguttaceae bacterium]